MSHEVSIHTAQTSILRELLFHPQAGFAQLQKPTGLESHHFTFHIGRLIDLKLVEKSGNGYRLTPKGKEYANRLDTDNNTVERQPKLAVLLALEREHEGKVQMLFQQRRKNPYFGFWGFPSGKMRWGETFTQAAARELMEETNLQADWTIRAVYHEHTYQHESKQLLEDKVFFMAHGINPRGKLMADFEGGHNEWLTPEEVLAKDKKYDTFKIELDLITSDEWLRETMAHYSAEQF